ncbi:MAG: peroxiredoxin, OsmC subfamily [Bacteroidetes bacterium]|jgi:osmotically inducible protein OsmC|nr:peroxiredoxin, OsmC subfamily [Bacteroidota bacterium]
MINTATAIWHGKGVDGKGALTSKSRALNGISYSYKTRTESNLGTNPEELVAAAHAGCFAMKLAFIFESAGYVADEINATCEVTFEAGEVTSSHIDLKVRMAGINKSEFDQLVEDSGKNCPISKLLKTQLTVKSELVLI